MPMLKSKNRRWRPLFVWLGAGVALALAIWLAAVVSATMASGQTTIGASSSFWGLVTIERTSGPQGTSASLSSGPKAQLLWLLPAVGLVIGLVKVGRNSRGEGLAKGAAAPMT